VSAGHVAVQLAAGAAFLAGVWQMFRFAMGLRAERLAREEARHATEARGHRVIAELPTAAELLLFLDEGDAFSWNGPPVRKADIAGARLLLNGAVVASAQAPGASLPELRDSEPYEGRERWDVRLYLANGTHTDVPCGTVREGVSREASRAVFEAVRAVFAPRAPQSGE
jgi:hypothetical protein